MFASTEERLHALRVTEPYFIILRVKLRDFGNSFLPAPSFYFCRRHQHVRRRVYVVECSKFANTEGLGAVSLLVKHRSNETPTTHRGWENRFHGGFKPNGKSQSPVH